jgi:hypothetical protein
MNYIVDFVDSMTLEEVQSYSASKNFTIIKHLSTFKNVFVVESNSVPQIDSQLLVVINDDEQPVELLNLDVSTGLDVDLSNVGTSTSFDINDEKNWWKTVSIENIDFDTSEYTHTVRGFGSTVYVIDSGIEDTHPEFIDANIVKLHSFTDNFIDTNGHGTALASVISGKTCGLTGATIKVVKIFDANIPTKQSDLLTAFDAIAEDYISCGRPLSVVNMSWGFARNDYINSKIRQLSDLGLFLIAAAGNSGIPISDVTPASISTVFVVGAFDQTLTPCDFSNYTSSDSIISVTAASTNYGELDAWAPGDRIWQAALNSGYGYGSGTSISAAITSGAVAYNLSSWTDLTGQCYEDLKSYSGQVEHGLLIQKYRTDITDEEYAFLYKNIPYSSILGKDQLLDLSDPKYINSYNIIIAYKGNDTAHNKILHTKMILPSNSTRYEILADRYSVSHISSNTKWPSWITVDNRGIATIQSPDIEEPYLIYEEIPLVRSFRDGTVGTEMIQFVVLRNDIDKNNINEFVPTGDPTLDIVLYAGCALRGFCSGTCPTGTPSCQTTIKSLACQCR